jgi:folate-dependent tRNA-U54 methylase TrmFO/GidA
VEQAAAKMGITIHFISSDPIDEFQPLNRAMFGVLKAQAKRLFHLNSRERRTKQYVVADIITA